MRWARRVGTIVAAWLLVGFALVPVAQAAPASLTALTSPTECSTELYYGDRRLGPQGLPTLGAVGTQLLGYSRTGYHPSEQFLDVFYDDAANTWRYPPQDGYVIGFDGDAVTWEQTLLRGTRIDRYGSEFGAFLAPQGLPYTTRAIPPANLVGNPAAGCNYHVYQVRRPFDVDAGPIAPWFFQVGGGLQYQLDGELVPGAPANLSVMWLLDNGYLARVR
ncbi:MAG: DUF4237 domain-containing protein [Actinophytocola sp.]|uniref:TNT domain-containing protein n=1 Tax=Actinophytocola sp. TaxID=1872138 RepID=UPI0013215B22|nr:TNT domain-containing protein [Actinophytocola sp.]MPZ83045.1 DUF4237 domain-containing protein [Actinophytocola sp.]